MNINHVYKNCEISFLCDTSLINKEEYSTILMFAFNNMFRYGFESLNMRRMWTETYSFRDGHLELLKDFLKMVKEGVLRDTVYCRGKYFDSIVHSKLRKEYESEK